MRKTKIVATVGPASNSYERLLELVEKGVNVFRLNFSHGTHADHLAVIEHLRAINVEKNLHIAILADLQGPKLRIGQMPKEGIAYQKGDTFYITQDDVMGTKEKVYLSYPNFYKDVKIGEPLYIDDGKIEVEVIGIEGTEVQVVVKIPGTIYSNKGINLPDTKISLPSLTEKDLADLDFILEQNLDWIALSFVRRVADVEDLRSRINAKNSKAKIISKIEKKEAIESIREIILASDGIMVARGDLGVELPLEEVPSIQKNIVRKCIHRAKPVIIATQMMESMMDRARPNRSEVTDVANAVLEGADAVMLSGETAVGQFPALVIETMSRIIVEVEKNEIIYNRNLTPMPHSPSFLSDALCYNACKIADDVNADAIVGMTQSGYTGFMLSSYRPESNLYVFTQTPSLINQLSLSWGVTAFFYDKENSLDEMIFDQIDILKAQGLLAEGDVVVSTGSTPIKEQLPTNLIKISKVRK